ncbi:response regulator [Neptunomonas japonica]|uniref:Two-component system, chemotaxis family, response regulator CheY n=1 Tax=Neptunomonas japonica JAMM 1380 TaxID=1441457 RepID=A0A7R6SWX8_9GAMM|nr:response regulator [Neptunomonas japonica]BBB30886.1 two-component system, chemotaxis family, response regulator CheY [Neptunomonas japonica JAMM 1380]
MQIVENADSKVVLIADDTQTIRAIVRASLKAIGFKEFHEVPNGVEAKQLLEAKSIDLVVCDWEMPEMNGLEVLKEMRGMERHKETPFVMLTGNANADLVNQSIQLGISGFVVKPFQPQALCEKIAHIFASPAPTKENQEKPAPVRQSHLNPR